MTSGVGGNIQAMWKIEENWRYDYEKHMCAHDYIFYSVKSMSGNDIFIYMISFSCSFLSLQSIKLIIILLEKDRMIIKISIGYNKRKEKKSY